MFEILYAAIAGTGLLALIGLILKWLVGAMGKHVDRMGRHVDNLESTFNAQSSRLVVSIDKVHNSLSNHIKTEEGAHNQIFQRLDNGDEFNCLLLGRVTNIETKIDDFQKHKHSAPGNGVS